MFLSFHCPIIFRIYCTSELPPYFDINASIADICLVLSLTYLLEMAGGDVHSF